MIRSLAWAFIFYVGLVSISLMLMGLYDRATGAPPPSGGPPHSPPANPFFYVAVLVIYSVPISYPVMALLLYVHFKGRESTRPVLE